MKEEKIKMSAKEKTWYICSITVAVVGLTFLVLGLVGDLLPYGNLIQEASDKFFMPWRYFGLIILAVGVVVLILALSINAKKTDRAADRALRRQQRLEALKAESEQTEETK